MNAAFAPAMAAGTSGTQAAYVPLAAYREALPDQPAIVAAEDTAAGKPAPDPYQRAVALLSTAMNTDVLAPGDCVAIEDSRWGIESARAAGLRAVGVTTSYDAGELAGADLIIGSLAELDVANLQRLLF